MQEPSSAGGKSGRPKRTAGVTKFGMLRAEHAPFATSVQGEVLINGVDIEQTLVIAEHELKRGRWASVLTIWGIRDQVFTRAQAQGVSHLYFEYIDSRKDYFHVWHFTWAISNVYRNGDAAVREELELAYQDAKERAKAAGGWADGLTNRNILMGDIHPPARRFVQRHVVAPGTSRYLQSLTDFKPFLAGADRARAWRRRHRGS